MKSLVDLGVIWSLRGLCRASQNVTAPPGPARSPIHLYSSLPLLPCTIERLDFGAAKKPPLLLKRVFQLE